MITGLKRTISIALCAAMLAASIPVNSEAHWDTGDKEKPVSISTREDGTVEVEDSWEETYPYGAFLFDNSESAVTEGGNEVTIPLYRLGGTKGRATAYIAYAPVVAIMGNETPAYGLAAGSDDVQISVENPLPIAQYQAVGKDADPDPSDAAIKEAEYVGSDAEPGDRSLTIEPQADGYQWYILHEGRWKIVEGAVKAEFVVSKDMMEDADFRCVYEKGGKKFCSMSYRGEAYEKPEPEVTEEAPNDIDLKPEKTFTDLDLSAGDPYSPAMFSVTFADGEWMKEIKVKAPDNEDADPIRMGTFTILDNQGGAIFEKASTVTLSVMDNDKGKPYSIGFEEKKVSADKAVGGAVVHLKRTGGGQDMISLDWKTADGTAKAGEDYESKTGTALFYADIDEVTIEIPLIDDGVKSNKEKTFSIELGELKGDPDGLCTLADSAIEVSVTNSGEGRSKFGSFLTIDPPGTEPEEEEEGPVTGQQVITPDEDLLYGEIAGYDGGETQSDGSGMDPSGTFNYGRISFDGKQHGGSYWGDQAYIAGKSNNDITGWSGGSAYGNGWQVESDDYKNSSISIPNMKSMYSRFHGNFEWNAALAKGWTLTWYGCCWAYGGAEVTSGKSSNDCNPRDTSHGLTYEVTWTTRGSIDTSWNMSENVNGVKLWISKNKDHNIGHDAYSRITEGYLYRRIFDNDLNLRIHTANDGESGDGNVVTAPDGAASLKKDSGVYASMKPEVLIEESNGGVNSSGKVYVGSKLRITLKNTDSYKPYSGSALNAAVYVTRKDGRIAPCKVEPGSNGIYYVTMLWDGINESDLEDTYTINIVMTRNQEIELNLRPSVPRKVDDKGQITPDIDTDKVGEAWDTFWRSGADHITLGVSNALHDAPHFGKKELSEIRIDRTEWVSGDKNPLKNLGRYENVQYINFNRNKKDVITLNGSRHKGNEKIYLATSDLAFAKVSFTYYNEQYLNMPNIMSTSITRTEVYFDGDGDGKISGKYNESTGYFELDKDGKDTFEFYMDEGCNYDEKMFQPVELEGGKFGQFFAKIFYTMTPRYLDKPDDVPDSDRAQVLPAFTTSRTDTEMLSRLTEEQNSYRYIISGQDGSGNRTADGHIMYGEKANAMQYVDVPLGGDHSPLQNRSEDPAKEDDMEWNPDYEGSLIYPFTNPEPIFVEHSLVGDNFPIAEFSYDNGVTTDAAAKDKLNGYLGSFTGDTTIALCVTKQEHTTDELHEDPESVVSLKPESSSLIDRSASPNGDWASKTDGGDMGNTGFDSGAAEHDYSEFDMDYGVNMPSMKGSLPQGLVTVVTGKNMFTILVSVPIYSKVKGKDGKVFPYSVKDPFNLTKDELKGLGDKMKTGSYDQLLDQWEKAGYKDSKSNKSIVCNKMSFSLNFSMSFTVKYDTDTNSWYFQEFAAGIGGTFSFKYTVRLAACPLLYGYLAVTAGITVGSGGTISHNVVVSQKPIVPENTDRKLKTGESLEFNTDYVNMLIRFKGKVYVEALDKKGDKEPSSGTRKGYISSNGESRVQVQFKDASDSMKFSSTKYVRIVALKDTSISYLNTIETVKSELLWSGVSVKPSVNVEIGVGAGVELAKLEAFIKLNISANFVFGQEQGDGSFKGFQVQSASFTLGLAIRATFLMFTFEMDAIAIKGSYAKSTDKWTWTYTVFGKDHPISAASSGGGGSGSSLQLPRDVSKTQTIYSSQKEPAGSGDGPLKPAQAYDPGDQFVPFQLSGYNSQSDALRLADGLDLNYSYRVVTVNDETKSVNNENYVVYMIGRPGSKGLDASMLAVSRLVTTDEGDGAKKEEESGNDNPGSDEDYGDGLGLVNPLDWEYREVKDGDKTYKYRAVKHPNERSETPYILIDLKKEGKNLVDDGTGDLEFDVKVSGTKINVAWVSYASEVPSPSEDTREAFQKSAKNTVVKQASYDITQKDGFSEAVSLSSHIVGSAVYDPTIIDDGHTAFVKANHVTDERRTELVAAYENKLNALGYYKDSENESNRNIFEYRMTNYENFVDYKGESSDLCVYSFSHKKLDEFENMNGSRSGYKPDEKTPVIDKLTGIPPVGENKDLYLAYTVWNEDLANTDRDKDGQHDSALYLTSFKIKESGGVHSPYGQWKVVSDNLKGKDGEGEHAMIDTLDFFQKKIVKDIHNVLDDNVLIAGQGEKLYTMPYAALETCLEDKGDMGADPLTRTSFYGGESSNGSRSSFVFGEDVDGNLITVYVSSVPDTTNTGLFLSTYDAKNKEWGKGVMLAMRHMDVYEDAAKYGWSREDTEKAYLGKLTDYSRGGMDQLQFYDPQIALGVKQADDGSSESETGKQSGFDRQGTSLVILTQGMMRYLTTKKDPEGKDVVMVGEPPEGAKYTEGMGIYAICYGVGHHSIGLGNLTFTSEDFSAGSQLSAGVSFVNTGDVSIRGSEDNPVTVTLNVSGDGFTSRKLAEWKVSENIRSGQEVQLFGTLTLPLTLPKGSEFSVTVSEDATYAEDPFSATVKGVYTIEQKTELGFENYDISLKRMDNGKLSLDENGNAILDVDLFVGNRGTKDSENVYIQFSYGVYDPELATRVKDKKGEDSDWSDTIYSALDITGHKLEVGEEEELPLLPPAGNANEDAAEGILNLGQIRAGYGRHVRGTIKVKADEFLYFGDDCINDPAGSMKLAVEIYGSDDVTLKDDFNIRHAERDEYNKINNTCDIVIEHTTSFVVPKKLEIPAGMRFRLPVSYSTTLGDQMPDINVVELTDSEIGKEALSGAGNGLSATGAENDNMDKSADVVSYENSSFKKGYGNGTVILRGGKEGNSYIRIQDMTTNSYQDIAVKFTAPADGLDIGTGSGLFTFLDENGKAAKSGGNSWEFQEDVEHWGKKDEKPFMGTLASGKPGTSFSFLTEAETIKLYFDGAVTVSSDFDGFRSVSRTSEGEPKEIYFGANPSNKAHTVTVTVTGVSSRGLYADFDRLDVFYSGDKVDLTEWQNDNPVSLVWGSTFPAPGSLSEGQVFDATAFVIDNEKADPDDPFSGLHFNWIKWVIGDNVTQLSFERQPPFRTYKWNVRFTKNGEAEFVFIGAYGKEVRSVLNVDWWETDGSSDYPEKSPALPYYEKKYPGVIDVVTPAGSTIEYLDNSWMTAGLDGNNVRVSIQDDAPADSLHVYLVDHDHYLRTLSLNKEYDPIELKKGETGSFSLRDGANGLHMLLAEAVVSRGTNERYDYHIFRGDGRIEKHNAEDVVHRNLEFLSLVYPNKTVDPELNPIPTVQYLPDLKLTFDLFDPLKDQAALYLLKGGKYTCEDGLTITPFTKGAVKVNEKNRKLTVKKDSLITVTKGDKTKTVHMYAVKIKKKTVTLNSRRKTLKLSEVFTNAGEMLPDVENGKFMVSVAKDDNGILKDLSIPETDGDFVTLDDFTIGSTGKKGSAVITATFGGKVFNATVKSTGYPGLPAGTLSGNLVQNLKEADEYGNRMLTFDSVEDGDTLLLYKKGSFALEPSVMIEPVGAEYSKAFTEKTNRKTGVNKITFRKEAPVKLTKDGASKIVLINLVSVKKKSVTLKPNKSCTLADLLGEAYELLPDPKEGDEDQYRINIIDRKGAVFIQDDAFPAGRSADGHESMTTLGDFTLNHSGRKGSAVVEVYFGGKKIKGKIICK